MSQGETSLRVDKWLWYARFFKTRSLAAKIVSGGAVRINGSHVKKPSAAVVAGDTLTFAQEKDIRVIRVEALGTRRGPASEARDLYEDLSPPEKKERTPKDVHPEADRSGRPTKKLRREMVAAKRRGLETE